LERQQAMLAKEIQFIKRFRGRGSHAAQVQSRLKKLDKIERGEPVRRQQSVQFEFRAPPRSGDDVVSFKNVHKGYDNHSVYADVDFQLRRKKRRCVLGAELSRIDQTCLTVVVGNFASFHAKPQDRSSTLWPCATSWSRHGEGR
jgi:ATPase subunit of ABC transporter with duplicated ATPase domains